MKKRIQDQQFQIDLLKTQLEVISLLLKFKKKFYNFKAEIIVLWEEYNCRIFRLFEEKHCYGALIT